MSETRTVVTSESFMQQLTGTTPAAPEEPKPAPTGEEVKTEGAETTGQEGTQQPKKKPLIEELVRTRHERNEVRTENERLRAEVEELRRQRQVDQAQPAPKELDPKPLRTQFVSDEDFLEALTDWKADQKALQQQDEQQQARIAAEQQQMTEVWNRQLDAAKSDFPDYVDIVGKADTIYANSVYTAIIESGPEMAYYLARNPDEAKRLASMKEVAAVRMIGKLEDRIGAELDQFRSSKKEAPKPSATTNALPEKSKAPPPIDPLKDASSPVEKPTSQMTYAEYKAFRQKQQAGRRR